MFSKHRSYVSRVSVLHLGHWGLLGPPGLLVLCGAALYYTVCLHYGLPVTWSTGVTWSTIRFLMTIFIFPAFMSRWGWSLFTFSSASDSATQFFLWSEKEEEDSGHQGTQELVKGVGLCSEPQHSTCCFSFNTMSHDWKQNVRLVHAVCFLFICFVLLVFAISSVFTLCYLVFASVCQQLPRSGSTVVATPPCLKFTNLEHWREIMCVLL